MEASEDIPQGAQVFDSYGEKCNKSFLVNYGFINLNKDGDNFDDRFQFSIDLDPEDTNLGLKKEIFLDGTEETNLEFRITGRDKDTFMPPFLSWIRFVVFNGD